MGHAIHLVCGISHKNFPSRKYWSDVLWVKNITTTIIKQFKKIFFFYRYFLLYTVISMYITKYFLKIMYFCRLIVKLIVVFISKLCWSFKSYFTVLKKIWFFVSLVFEYSILFHMHIKIEIKYINMSTCLPSFVFT